MITHHDDVRTIIDLPEDQLAGLDALCRAEGVSRAEAIRRAVAGMLARNQAAHAGRAYGLWKGRRLDGPDYQQALRHEWDR